MRLKGELDVPIEDRKKITHAVVVPCPAGPNQWNLLQKGWDHKYKFYQGKYGFPAGGVNTGEELWEAALREVHEETGYIFERSDLKRSQYMGLYKHKVAPGKFIYFHSTSFELRERLYLPNVKLNPKEHIRLIVAPESLLCKMRYQMIEDSFEDFVEFKPQAA